MNDERLEIVFCTDGIFPLAIGGMQRHSRLLIEELSKDQTIRLVVIHPHIGKQIFSDITGIKEIAVDPGKSSGRYLVDCYKYSKKVYQIVQQYPQAIIYAQGLTVWYHIKKIKNRVIVNPHGLEPYQTLSFKDNMIGAPFRLIFNYLFRQAASVVSLGGRLTGILENATGNQNNKVVVLPNAVNIPDEYDRTYDNMPLQFLFVGRFALNKGINVLLETIVALNLEGYQDKFVFNLVGKGPLFETYKLKYNVSNINFLGFADDDKLPDIYKSNDVFVLPTLFEGMPTVVLEAMCYGMPVIVTDVGATTELVNEKNGFIIEKNDALSLKKAILKYYHLPVVERKNFGRHAYLKVKDNFTWPTVAQQHKKLFYELWNRVKV